MLTSSLTTLEEIMELVLLSTSSSMTSITAAAAAGGSVTCMCNSIETCFRAKNKKWIPAMLIIDCNEREIKIMILRFLALVLSSSLVFLAVGQGSSTYNVLDNGAIGDGHTDDANAFMKTWGMGCEDTSFPTILVPQGKAFLLTQVSFTGPCKSKIHVQIDGNVMAPGVMWAEKEMDHWIRFLSVNELIIDGSGQIDGQGHAWWPCRKQTQPCPKIPNTMGIMSCQNVQLTHLKFKDSPGKHITIYKSSDVHLSDLSIDAPENSPNTDGIHIEGTTHSDIFGSSIRTGDDCISIGTGTYDLKIGHVACGPGHGISIGSLGEHDSEAKVEQIQVFSCQFFNTMNGVRIKTWQGGYGYAKGIIFEKLNFTKVQNPIVINQFYCEYAADGCPIKVKSSAVRVSDVHYIDVGGTTNSKLAINLNCSQSMQCTDIIMKTVNIQETDAGVKAESYCINASGKKQGHVIPEVPCLRSTS